MDRRVNLTEGSIFKSLFRLSLPLMGTAFIQIAYNLTDTLWLGRMSAEHMAAAGLVSFLLWFGSALVSITRVGMGVKIAQSVGARDRERALNFAHNGYVLNGIILIIYGSILWFFRSEIIGFFNVDSAFIEEMAGHYLKIITLGLWLFFYNPILSVTLNSQGDSVTPFKINTTGLLLNIFLDPLLIFGWGPIPSMGVIGAAYATVAAQALVFTLFMVIGVKRYTLYMQIPWREKLSLNYFKDIVVLGIPAFIQTGVHAGVGMVLTKMVASFGDMPVAVYSGGQQIESVSWMTAEGVALAISTFIGQNFGAGKRDRLIKGYRYGILYISFFGLLGCLLLVFAGEAIMGVFLPNDPAGVIEGGRYLAIVGLSHIFMNMELGSAGAFQGIGKAVYPAVVGILFNLLRIPLAYGLMTYGVSGIWWSISISSILKGIICTALFVWVFRRMPIIEQGGKYAKEKERYS